MDTLTHALLSAAAAYATKTARTRLSARQRLGIGAVAGAFPDADFLLFAVDPLRFIADWHQAATHSLVLLPLWAFALGTGCLVVVHRRLLVCGEAMVLAAVALLTHIAADLLTAYGTAVFHPVSDVRLRPNTTFVIDPVFTGIVVVALAFALRGQRRLPLAFGLAALCTYVGAQGLLRERALELARASLANQGLPPGRLTALPQPLSPFNWKLLDAHEAFHRISHVNLAGHPPLVPALPGLRRLRELARTYSAPDAIEWTLRPRYGAAGLRPLVEERWLDPRFESFRRFATHPSVSRVEPDAPATCIWFTDLRLRPAYDGRHISLWILPGGRDATVAAVPNSLLLGPGIAAAVLIVPSRPAQSCGSVAPISDRASLRTTCARLRDLKQPLPTVRKSPPLRDHRHAQRLHLRQVEAEMLE